MGETGEITVGSLYTAERDLSDGGACPGSIMSRKGKLEAFTKARQLAL